MNAIKEKILLRLLSQSRYMLIKSDEYNAFVAARLPKDENERHSLTKMLSTAIERDVHLRGVVLNASLEYLDRYEVDRKHFIEKLYGRD